MNELARTIGSRIEELREAPDGLVPKAGVESALTASDVASAAREIGIPWRISTVRAIELGDRKIWAVEFLLLGEIFRRAWAHKGVEVRMPLATFLPKEPVVAGAVVVDPDELRNVVSGHPFPPGALETAAPEVLAGLPARAARLEPRWVIPAADLPSSLDLRQLGREAKGEAEQKLARKFGVPAEAIVIAAHARWGMGLTAVRDRELGDVSGLPADTVRTKRGRVTLRLGKELERDVVAVHDLLVEAGGALADQRAGPQQAMREIWTPEELVAEYSRFVELPWRRDPPVLDRLLVLASPLGRAGIHLRLLGDLKRVTEEAGHRWVHLDLFVMLGRWAPSHHGVEEYWSDRQKAGELDELMQEIEVRLEEAFRTERADDDTVVALDGVGSLVPYSRFADVLQRAASLVPGRLLAFVPRPEEDGPSRFLIGSDGWELLKETLDPTGSGL